jgi:cytochrome c oxidase assembly protein subunit 15
MTTRPSPWIHRFAALTALATLVLVGIGGLVTSHGVGMAVPDWPNTYGYNMFFFPISQWVGGVFYEHSHRLFASGVGLLTTILALWLYGKNARPLLRWGGLIFAALGLATGFLAPRHRADGIVLGITGLAALLAALVWPRCEPSPKWLRRLGLLAFIGVVLQGILGGLRVVLFRDQIGIFHATLAQLFFVLVCSLALFTSPSWQNRNASPEIQGPKHAQWLGPLFLVTTLLILGQLVLGATMRHQHAGLAIPDFPLAYGKLWPAMDPGSVARYNQQRIEVVAANPITSVQIALQMVHRLVAGFILFGVGFCAASAQKRLGTCNRVARLTLLWLALVLIQVLLGAATIWSNKAADIATLHVLSGALLLAFGGILTIVVYDQKRAAPIYSAALRAEASPLSAVKAVPSSIAHVD